MIQMKIENLLTVTLEVDVDTTMVGSTSQKNNSERFEFIFGAASRGLTPFELDLHGRDSGETLELSVPGTKTHDYFGHLHNKVFKNRRFSILPESFLVKARIIDVRVSEEREIVQAIAHSLSHTCGNGSCDCGCS